MKPNLLETLFGSEPVQKLIGRMTKLPNPPSTYFNIVRESQSSTSSLGTIGTIIAQDSILTAKLLDLVNSGPFGLQQPASTPSEVLAAIGVEMTRPLVLLAHAFACYEATTFASWNTELLWQHSLKTAQLARAIAEAEDVSQEKRAESFTAGLVHDLRKLLLAANEAAEFQRAQGLSTNRSIPLWQAEQALFGATHADLGAWLAAVWRLPLSVVEAILLHHHPARLLSRKFCPLAAVHVANVLCQTESDRQFCRVDEAYLGLLGLQGRQDVWQQLARNANTGASPTNNSQCDAMERRAA